MSTQKPKTAVPSLSVIITAHAEGILAYKTLGSVRRALAPLAKRGIVSEIILHCDTPTPATTEFIETNKKALQGVRLFTNSFKDLGPSRNFGVKQAKGKYVTFIDADDLVSEFWFERAYDFLEQHEFGQYIAHTESTVEFGGSDGVIIKHGEINQATDTLLSVFANRWNSIVMAPRELLLAEPYTSNSPGYGYEDWHLNCRLILRGVHNVLIPHTAVFVRRKASESEWLRQRMSRSVLPANPLFAFDRIRAIEMSGPNGGPDAARVVMPKSMAAQMRAMFSPMFKRVPGAERYARRLYDMALNAKNSFSGGNSSSAHIPTWLADEWRNMHTVEKQVFPTKPILLHVPIYDSITPEHYQAAQAFKELINHTTHNQYGYILFVPWLIKGGADLFAIHYANTFKQLHPDKNVLVVATVNRVSDWASKLIDGVDFMPYGTIAGKLSREVQFRLLEQLIENSGAQCLHILNSELAYNFVAAHEQYLRATNKKLVVTSFSQSTDKTGRIFGYSHTHVPQVYDLASLVTTDNEAVTKMWINEYGFDPAKLVVHHQPVELPKVEAPNRPITRGALRVLWAARLCPEKQPELVAKIGRLLQDRNIAIDMYGQPDKDFNQSFLRSLPPNVHYKGPFDGFFTLPLDQYDAYLYTSLFDGMPNVILEAAGAKLPIVSAAVGGVPELIQNEESGLLVPTLDSAEEYADALRRLYNHPDELEQFAHKLHTRLAERHAPDAYQQQIKAFLKKLDY
jgi:glycosyltransferase involved in cell wall biosynthesis